jgi:hypothetical protein
LPSCHLAILPSCHPAASLLLRVFAPSLQQQHAPPSAITKLPQAIVLRVLRVARFRSGLCLESECELVHCISIYHDISLPARSAALPSLGLPAASSCRLRIPQPLPVMCAHLLRLCTTSSSSLLADVATPSSHRCCPHASIHVITYHIALGALWDQARKRGVRGTGSEVAAAIARSL